MNVASKDLCEELYKLSGWGSYSISELQWFKTWSGEGWEIGMYEADVLECFPAYDLGYLLRKLPLKVKDEYQADLFGVRMKQTNGSGWVMWYGEIGKDSEMYFNSADTPEDCAANLAIQLFEVNILKRSDA